MVIFISLIKAKAKIKHLNEQESPDQESTNKISSNRKEPTMKVVNTKKNEAYGLTVLVNE